MSLAVAGFVVCPKMLSASWDYTYFGVRDILQPSLDIVPIPAESSTISTDSLTIIGGLNR